MKISRCYMSHFLSLLESFQTVIKRSRMMLTNQHCIVINTFNRRSIKPIQDSILCVSNFHMYILEYRTFRTKDFSHKSFSTSFGTFAQFLVVISHNNYKWETSVSAGFAHNEFRPRSVSPITRMVSPRHKFDSPRLTVSDYPG